MEPGIEPILRWQELRPKHRFWRDDGLFERAFGDPVDPEYWAANNPATIVTANAGKLRDSGLAIYLEAGDLDEYWLYEGTEFLHQVLWDRRVPHEYHLVRGAGHGDGSLRQRIIEAYKFLARTIDPWPPRELAGEQKLIQDYLNKLRTEAGEADHYSQTDAKPTITNGW